MTKSFKGQFLTLSLLAFAFVASYVNFSTYRPKVIRQVEDVKGLQTEVTSDLPLPQGAEKIGTSRSFEGEQTTFHTNKTKQEIQDFYKNIFVSNKWELESQGTYDDFIIARYHKDNISVSIITYDTNDEYKTLVSLEKINL